MSGGQRVGVQAFAMTADAHRRDRGFKASPRGMGLHPKVSEWLQRINTQGGIVYDRDITACDRLVKSLMARSFASKIVTVYPFLGISGNSWGMPVIDTLGKGFTACNGSFSFIWEQGLKGDGSTAYIDSLIKPSELGSSNSGGMGWFDTEVDISGSTYAVMGCSNNAVSNYYTVRLYNTPYQNIIWGATANGPTGTITNTTYAHLYGQRNGATLREVYYNGVSAASNTTSDATSGANEKNIQLFGWNVGSRQFYKGRCGICYFTDGTLTATEIAQLHDVLRVDFLWPTGRLPTS